VVRRVVFGFSAGASTAFAFVVVFFVRADPSPVFFFVLLSGM